MIEAYLDELSKTKSNKTRNNHLTNIRALLNLINGRERIWHIIPGKEIKKLSTTTNLHAVFSKEQIKKNREACNELGEEYLWLFCEFMLYSLARPAELRKLKVEDLDVDGERIYFRGENSKGGAGEWIDMYPPLKAKIVENKLHMAPKSYYVFSAEQTPGPNPVGINYFYKRHLKMLNSLGLAGSDMNYTLYSYKHSGCCHLYNDIKDVLIIQQQCRHKSPEQTMGYLRDLGLFRKKEHFSKVTAF